MHALNMPEAHGLRKRPGITPDQIHAWETGASYFVRPSANLLKEQATN